MEKLFITCTFVYLPNLINETTSLCVKRIDQSNKKGPLILPLQAL